MTSHAERSAAAKSEVSTPPAHWRTIIDSFAFFDSGQYSELNNLMLQQPLSKALLEKLWGVLTVYQPYNVDAALLLLKRGSLPKNTGVIKYLLWYLKIVGMVNGKTSIDPSITEEDLNRFHASIEQIKCEPPYVYEEVPRPSAMPGRVGDILFDNVRIPKSYKLAKVAADARAYNPSILPDEQVVNFYRLLHGCMAVYMILYPADGQSPGVSFANMSEPVHGMVLLRSEMEHNSGFDHLYTLFLDAISDVGFLPRLKLASSSAYDGLQVFSASLPELTTGKDVDDWQWLQRFFENRLAEGDQYTLLPLINAAIAYLSEGIELSPEILHNAELKRVFLD